MLPALWERNLYTGDMILRATEDFATSMALAGVQREVSSFWQRVRQMEA